MPLYPTPYRDEYDTFEEYCRERWGWSRRHANRTIAAADVAETVAPMGAIESHSPIGERPNEGQARELAPLARKDPEKAIEVWSEVVESTEGRIRAGRVALAAL